MNRQAQTEDEILKALLHTFADLNDLRLVTARDPSVRELKQEIKNSVAQLQTAEKVHARAAKMRDRAREMRDRAHQMLQHIARYQMELKAKRASRRFSSRVISRKFVSEQ